MFRQRLLFLFVFLLLGFQVSYGDMEFWSVDTFQFPVKEGLVFNVIPELRYRNNPSELYYLQIYLGPSFAPAKNFTMNIYYSPKFVKSSGNWSSANALYFDAVSAWRLFSDRSRFEYDPGSATLKYRNNLQLKTSGWSLGDEIFYNFKKADFDENRWSVAYSFKMTANFTVALGGMLRSQKALGGDWSNTNVLTFNTTLMI